MSDYDFSAAPIESIYQALGSIVVESIDEEWATATLYAEIEDDDSGTLYGRYTTQPNGSETGSFDPDYRSYMAFDELRQRMKRPDQPAWTKARFVLQRTGKFDLEFEYPDQASSGSAA